MEVNSSHQQAEPAIIPAGKNQELPAAVPSEAESAAKLRIVAGFAKVSRKDDNKQ
ncbi:hypothetical protein D3C73_1381170 [compost metagenome]